MKKLITLLTCLLFLLSFSSKNYAQIPYQVKDIYAGASSGIGSSGFYPFNYNGVFLFQGTTANEGTELWRTDGTTAGTYLVKDIAPGTYDSYATTFFEFNGIVYFAATTVSTGTELWRTDGTSTGTYMVKDIYPGTSDGFLNLYVYWQHNGFFYFGAYSLSNADWELWKSDGTTAGTTEVKDINPGIDGSYPNGFYEFNNELYFVARNAANGKELWKTDGTTSGTALVKDIYPGADDGVTTLSVYWQHNGFFYFGACSLSGTDWELWRSDGTSAATTQVKDINPGVDGSYPNGFYVFSNELYFTARNTVNGKELWKTDGTTAGTALIKDIYPGVDDGVTSLSVFWQHNGFFYFGAYALSGTDYEIWKSDGTTAGTTQLKDINPGTDGCYPNGLFEFNNELYFSARNAVNGKELWKTDGTTAGTALVKDIYPGTNDGLSNLYLYWQHNGFFYFGACSLSSSDWELWKSDGTTAGTTELKDINTGAGGSFPSGFYEFNNELYFEAGDVPNGNELWKTDGTTAGTTLVKDIYTGGNSGLNYFYSLFQYNGFFYFTADNLTNGNELWKSDGTTAGTNLVMDIYPGITNSYPSNFNALNNTYMMFNANDATGKELWTFNMPGISSGVEDIVQDTEIKLFPNPAHTNLRVVSSAKKLNISMFDIAGKCVTQFICSGGISNLDVSNYNPGMYFFAINDGSRNIVKKIIIQ